jgi:hypothetical protein
MPKSGEQAIVMEISSHLEPPTPSRYDKQQTLAIQLLLPFMFTFGGPGAGRHVGVELW